MPIEPTILVLDGAGAPRQSLAQRLRRMGYRAIRAKTPEDAFAIVEEPRHHVTAAMIPPDLAVADLRSALEALSARSPAGRLAYVVVGPCPDEAGLSELRDAGLVLALWEPLDDARLRYQANRALAGIGSDLFRRGGMRAPLEIGARVIQAGRSKDARVYTLSTGGVYLDTARPAMRNAAVEVELDFWPSPIRATGVVAYTSVPGNLRRTNLPIGMGVRFDAIAEPNLARIRRAVAEVSLQLTV